MNTIYHEHSLSTYNYVEALLNEKDNSQKIRKIIFPHEQGTGFMNHIALDNGCAIRYVDFVTSNDMPLATLMSGAEDFYKLVFNLEHPLEQAAGLQHSKLYNRNFVFHDKISKGTTVKKIVFVFSEGWLDENMHDAVQQVNMLMNIRYISYQPAIVDVALSPRQLFLSFDLKRQMKMEAIPLINVKSKSLSLLNDVLEIMLGAANARKQTNDFQYYKEMLLVESILNDSVDKPMPCIATLAREVNMSPATLTRHFKLVFNSCIYNYYLEKKIAFGKKLLDERNKTVSEVAYTLGYNKINSFSKAFKKYYGILPKEAVVYNV